MNQPRLTKQGLWDILEGWEEYIPSRIRLVACGGTALTLQDIKESTRDVDFVVPDHEEFDVLIRTIKKLGYRPRRGEGWAIAGDPFIFDLFKGQRVFTTGLLDSPLDAGRHIPIREIGKLHVSALNDLDLVISKMIRGEEIDVQDCLALIKARGGAFDVEAMKARYKETASFDVGEQRVLGHLKFLLTELEGGSHAEG